MIRRLGLCVALILAFVPGCKGMGGLASGLGKVAAGAARGVAHVAAPVAHSVAKVAPALAHGAAKAAPTLARAGGAVARASGAVVHGVVRTTPAALEVGEAIAEAALTPTFVYDVSVEPAPRPVMEVTDPCEACPLDLECGVCVGYAGYACVAAQPGLLARCASSAPPDAPPAPAMPPAPEPNASSPDPDPDPGLPPR